MAVTQDNSGPYAPPSTVIDVITRHRTRGLPSPVNADVLARSGVSDSLIPRTLQALQSLDLLDEQGQPTSIFEGLRLAPESEFKQRMAEWLNQAYADVIAFVDPATDDEIKVRDAFRSYKPVGQQARMVTLFLGLYREAGVAPEKSSQPRMLKIKQSVRPRSVPQRTNSSISSQKKPPLVIDSAGIPAPLAGMLAKLPQEGDGWTKARRDKFMTTFESVMDFCFPIIEFEAVELDSLDDD